MARLYLAEQSALAVGGHYFAYSRCVALAARRAGLDVTILQNRAFEGDWDVEGAEIVSAFRHTWSEAETLWIREWGPGHIAWDLHEATRSRPPVAGDHVLFTTLGSAEMRALLDYLIELPAGFDHPAYHLLLRYDPAGVRAELNHYKPLFDRIAKSALLRRIVRFHTDTDLLSADYAGLFGVPFTTLPIPFDQTVLIERMARRRRPGPLVVTYLGDARLEKGFAGIPAAVASLWDAYVLTGKVRFVIQSNFNVPDGEPGMLQAVQKLAQYPPSMVEIIDRPMQGDVYAERLASADIVIIPYDAARYRARSSGILVEAMAAGKPVVASRGTWMETQVDPTHAILMDDAGDLARALKQAIDDYAALKKGAARLQPEALANASGDHFVQAIIATTEAGPAEQPLSAPRVLVVVDGNALVLRNGFGVVAINQFRYLASAGYRIVAVVVNGRRDSTLQEIESWSDAVRERLSPFDLEGVFIAGSGRLSFDVLRQQHTRVSSEPSISGDMEAARGYDVSLDLVAFLTGHAVDAVLINGVVNWPLVERLGLVGTPVICETHDIQSFQKAIYGKRRLLQTDLDVEADLLRRCQHLISLSPSETAYLRELLPEAHVTTVGVYPALPDLGVRTLAGIETLAEVIAACDPSLDIYRGGVRPSRRSGEAERLARARAIDLVYVSSNHAANVSGLRWFLESVYFPHLAPAGVTFAIAGSISDWEWPVHENLFILGRLQHLDPLYAAANLVVLPITEGAGAAVKTIEAMTFGRPIVATSIAMRGLGEAVGGVTIADTSEDMVEAIQVLLASSDLREREAEASRISGWRLADPRDYARALDGVFADVLAERAVPSSVVSPKVPDHVEPWSETLRSVNRLARCWLEEEPLDPDALTHLANRPADLTLSLLHGVLGSLVVDRDAFCLSCEPHLLVAAAARTAADVARFCEVIEVTLKVVNPDTDRSVSTGDIEVVCEAALPVLVTMTALDWALEGFGGDTAGSMASAHGERSVRLEAQSAARSDLHRVLLKPSHGGHAGVVVIFQSIPLDGAYRPRGQGAVIETGGEDASIAGLKDGDSIQLTLPELYSPSRGRRLVEILVDTAGTLELEVLSNGRLLPVAHFRDGPHHVLRFDLTQSPIVSISVSVDVVSGSGVLREVRNLMAFMPEGDTHVLLPDPAGMTLVPTAEGRPDASSLSVFRGLVPIMAAVRSGVMLPRYRAIAARARLLEIGPGADGSAMSTALQMSTADVVRLFEFVGLKPAADTGGGGLSWASSSGLTIQVAADFPDIAVDASVVCRIDGLVAEAVSQSATRRIWRLAGEVAGDREPWLRSATFSVEAGQTRKSVRWRKARRFILKRLLRALGAPRKQYEKWLDAAEFADGEVRAVSPASTSLVYRFEAALDLVTGSCFARLGNAHEPEGTSLVWTGPGKTSVFSVPLALAGPGVLTIGLANLGTNGGLDDINVELNGVALRLELGQIEGDTLLTAAFEADPDAIAATELRISVRRVGQLGGDHRNLGVAITFIQFALAV